MQHVNDQHATANRTAQFVVSRRDKPPLRHERTINNKKPDSMKRRQQRQQCAVAHQLADEWHRFAVVCRCMTNRASWMHDDVNRAFVRMARYRNRLRREPSSLAAARLVLLTSATRCSCASAKSNSKCSIQLASTNRRQQTTPTKKPSVTARRQQNDRSIDDDQHHDRHDYHHRDIRSDGLCRTMRV